MSSQGLTLQLVDAVGRALHAAGLGVWSPEGTTPLPASGVAVVAGTVPASPDRVIVLGTYTVSDSVEGHRIQGVQIRTRGLPRVPLGTADLDDGIYDALHGASLTTSAGVVVPLLWRVSVGALGVDTNARTETAHNFHAHLDAPTEHTRQL